MFIAIAGNIGSGKTTLTQLLSNHYGWIPKYESIINNPYIEDYYADMRRWAFNLEVYFLKERFKDVLHIRQGTENIVQDRTIYEGVHVFATNNYLIGNLSKRDYEAYMELFENMTELIPAPDLMIYLRSSVGRLTKNIKTRGREYEKSIPHSYLETLNEQYEKFIFENYPGKVLVIEADNYDFLENQDDRQFLFQQIDNTLKK